jgi:hypothetical protein
MQKRVATVVFVVFLAAAVAGWSGTRNVYVNVNAAAGGDGRTPATAYRTIREAVADVNERNDSHDYIIHIAEGTYVEPPDAIRITRDGVRLLGSTKLMLDETGLPTGAYQDAAIVRPALPAGTLIPAGSALVRVSASHVGIAGLVLDGGVPGPPLGPPAEGLLLVVDGAPVGRQLTGISIQRNAVINTSQATLLRLASITATGNFFARSNLGLSSFGGFENLTHPELESTLVVSANRFVDHRNIALNVLGSLGLVPSPTTTPGLVAGPTVNRSLIERNDFARNGNGNDGSYPQPTQYSALNFNPMNDTSDTRQPSRLYTEVRQNRFIENGYGVSVSQRVRLNQEQTLYTFSGRLTGNTYCGNGLNDAFFNFSLNAQSHGGAQGGQFRYATNSIYTIDASADGLTSPGFDLDHPLFDPRLPLNAPGTLPLANLLEFNGAIIANGVQITRPPLVSTDPPVFAPIDLGLTPSLSLVGAARLIINSDSAFVDPGAVANDPCEGDISERIVTTGSVDATTPGSYVVRYEVTNAVGKSADPVERTVIVKGKGKG